MAFTTDKWKPLTSQRGYIATDKEPEGYAGKYEMAYYVLAGNVKETFGDTPATPMEIYQSVTSPLGLSTQDTNKLIQSAKATGYLRLK